MKKALSVFLMLALVGSVFAAEPVADVNIAEFKGDASVQWGVDLDTGETGFKNSANVSLKLNLLNEGSKSTTGDGIWGELVIKTDGDTFAKATNTSSLGAGLGTVPMTVIVDKAQINFGSAYVGITSGDTQTGKLKMDAAVKSADSDNAVTLPGVGPEGYAQGIVLGYSNDTFNVAADLRSYGPGTHVYVVTWSKFVPGYPMTMIKYFSAAKQEDALKEAQDYVDAINKKDTTAGAVWNYLGDYTQDVNQYTDMYAVALEGEFTGVENLSVKAGASYNFGVLPTSVVGKYSTLGYSTSVGYKLGLNDTFYVRPQLGLGGSTYFSYDKDFNYTKLDMVAGVLFGWGDIGIDDDPNVYFMDDDATYKKVSPGVGVVVEVPLLSSASYEGNSYDFYGDAGYDTRVITITPSFFSGELVPGLTAATYSKLQIGTGDTSSFGYNIVSGAKYAIPVAAGTITPQVGMSVTGNKEKATELLTKVGVEAAGFVSNTTFGVEYVSGNLIAEPKAVIGTLNFKTKISF